jgi:hypothetical protein
MELGHLLTLSGLTHPEVSSKFCHVSFCQLGNSLLIYFNSKPLFAEADDLNKLLENSASCWLKFYGNKLRFAHKKLDQNAAPHSV